MITYELKLTIPTICEKGFQRNVRKSFYFDTAGEAEEALKYVEEEHDGWGDITCYVNDKGSFHDVVSWAASVQ